MATITTLIPAYKKEYLTDVFRSLLRQTFKDFKIILSDDSPGQIISKMIQDRFWGPALDKLDLTVIKGPGNAVLNHEYLLDHWACTSSLVHFFLDDDIIFPTFYETHVSAHEMLPCSASVSARWWGSDDGFPSWISPLPDLIRNKNNRIFHVNANDLHETAVANCHNWLGELSNIVLSSDAAKQFPRSPVRDSDYYGLMDMGTLLQSSRILPISYIREYLGVFRQNSMQTTNGKNSASVGGVTHFCWVNFALLGWQYGHLSSENAIKAISTASKMIQRDLKHLPECGIYFNLLKSNSNSLHEFQISFRLFWMNNLKNRAFTTN